MRFPSLSAPRGARARPASLLVAVAAFALLGTAVVPDATASAAEEAAAAHGLKGEYYTQSAAGAFDFDELKATTVDPNLDFDSLEERLQARTGQSDDATVRWTGKITPEKAGDHVFSMTGDNGFRLWIDNKIVIDHWVDDWDREQNSQPVSLEPGRAYDFKVEYFEHFGGSNLHLRWTPPGGEKTAVPPSAFTLPDGMDYNGPTARGRRSVRTGAEPGVPRGPGRSSGRSSGARRRGHRRRGVADGRGGVGRRGPEEAAGHP
ncbi:UNVERIFIED_CONTAM: hypothetical protein RKD43_006756 [Streptomyces graminofaciens]